MLFHILQLYCKLLRSWCKCRLVRIFCPAVLRKTMMRLCCKSFCGFFIFCPAAVVWQTMAQLMQMQVGFHILPRSSTTHYDVADCPAMSLVLVCWHIEIPIQISWVGRSTTLGPAPSQIFCLAIFLTCCKGFSGAPTFQRNERKHYNFLCRAHILLYGSYQFLEIRIYQLLFKIIRKKLKVTHLLLKTIKLFMFFLRVFEISSGWLECGPLLYLESGKSGRYIAGSWGDFAIRQLIKL